ncbi:MAG: DUF1127 domain-containing protein [Xanthobacteraceae bacterium]
MSFPAAHASLTTSFAFRRRSTSAALKAVVLEWRKRIRDRRALASMTERDRRDVGFSNCDVDAETSKPFWIP